MAAPHDQVSQEMDRCLGHDQVSVMTRSLRRWTAPVHLPSDILALLHRSNDPPRFAFRHHRLMIPPALPSDITPRSTYFRNHPPRTFRHRRCTSCCNAAARSRKDGGYGASSSDVVPVPSSISSAFTWRGPEDERVFR